MLTRNRSRLAVGMVAAIVAGGGLWWATTGDAERPPTEVVAEFLDAVGAGDVERALSHTGWTPDDDSGVFLTPEALDDDWTVDRIVETDRDGGRARVEVTIASSDLRADGVFELHADADSWRLDRPYAEIGFGESGLGYMDVNGQRHVPESHPADQRYLLLPGLYHFYAADNQVIDVGGEPRLLLPGEGTTWVEAEVVVTEAGREAAQRAVDGYVEDCASTGDVYRNHCPFAVDAVAVDALIGVEYMNDVRNLDWEVTEYPQVDVTYQDGRFRLTDVQPGEIEVSGTGTERLWDSQKRKFYDGEDIDFTLDCRIEARWLELTVEFDGGWSVHHFAQSGQGHDWRPGSVVETCGAVYVLR